jgi:hypothetical protein
LRMATKKTKRKKKSAGKKKSAARGNAARRKKASRTKKPLRRKKAGGVKKPLRRKKASGTKKPLRRKKASGAKKPLRRKKASRRRRLTQAETPFELPMSPAARGLGGRAAGQSGDTQGLSRSEDVDSESVEELAEEGQAFEAEVVSGVEDALDPDEGEVRTKEVPEDDVPGEYTDKD